MRKTGLPNRNGASNALPKSATGGAGGNKSTTGRNVSVKSGTKRSQAAASNDGSTSSDDDVTASPSGLAIALDDIIQSRIAEVLKDHGIEKWIKDNKIKPSVLVKTILASPNQTSSKKTAAPVNKIPIKVLKQVLSTKFDDGYREGCCIVSCAYRAPDGRLPYTLCAQKVTGSGMVCEACIKKSTGKTLGELSCKRGYDVEKYRENNIVAGKRWATNKMKILERETDGKIKIEGSVSDDTNSGSNSSSSASDEESSTSKSQEETTYEWTKYDHDEKYSYSVKEGLVSENKEGDYIVIGIDKNNSGNIEKLTKAEVLKFEKQRLIVAPSSLKTSTNAAPATKIASRQPLVARRPGQGK